MIMAIVVVLPAPLPPSRPVTLPAGKEKEMPSTAVVDLYFLTSRSTDTAGSGDTVIERKWLSTIGLRMRGDVTVRRGSRKRCVRDKPRPRGGLAEARAVTCSDRVAWRRTQASIERRRR